MMARRSLPSSSARRSLSHRVWPGSPSPRAPGPICGRSATTSPRTTPRRRAASSSAYAPRPASWRQLPGIGRSRKDLRPDLFSFPVGKHVLFYRPQPGGIVLVRVIHGARDLPALFSATD